MSEPVEIFLGFDPGGKGADNEPGKFGWSICRDVDGQIQFCNAGVAKYAGQVVERVLEALPANPRVLAIGIDAPLFWSVTGKDREIDETIRRALQKQGWEPSRGVQQINSLQGACLVQGILLGASLYQRFKAPVTESHPGALKNLDKFMPHCVGVLSINDHEFDATYAAYAAWCMHRRAPGWRDLFPEEPNPVLPLGTPVSYWMPIP